MPEHQQPTNPGESWGGDPAMSAWDALMWRTESDPRTSSAGLLVEILEHEPDWERFVNAHERTVTRIPRLRDRVVEPVLPVVQPTWSADPNFELRHHVRRVRLLEPANERALLEQCAALWQTPLDPRRPPWEATLFTGLEGGRAAYAFRCHHSLTDGSGLVQLLDIAHSRTSEPSPPTSRALVVVRPETTPHALFGTGMRDRISQLPSLASRNVSRTRSLLTRVTREPGTVAAYLRSLRRLLETEPGPRSTLLATQGTEHALLTLDVPLPALKAAGRAAGGSVNDAYLAAVLGGLRRYHEKHGLMVDRIPIGMPVSLRTEGDATGGNKFAGVRFSAPVSESNPIARMKQIGDFVRGIRDEPAIGFMEPVSEALSLLPKTALIELTAKLTAASDLQVSNIRGLDERVFLAGAEVLAMYTFGPRPGVAAMVTLLTYGGSCGIGLTVDARTFPDLDLLRDCLVKGIDEVLAVGDVVTEGAGR
ncbi:MAG TPA: wax ester/triacylglycerol synthase domain-containing protein [Nocardioidaceae bacterium]|nr:wax ester/triacylglycerol synthase domain-containing protein [Nocardioidaceae bacterium]